MRPYGEEYQNSNCPVHGHGSRCIVSDEMNIRLYKHKSIKSSARFRAKIELDRELESAILEPVETDPTTTKETENDYP